MSQPPEWPPANPEPDAPEFVEPQMLVKGPWNDAKERLRAAEGAHGLTLLLIVVQGRRHPMGLGHRVMDVSAVDYVPDRAFVPAAMNALLKHMQAPIS